MLCFKGSATRHVMKLKNNNKVLSMIDLIWEKWLTIHIISIIVALGRKVNAMMVVNADQICGFFYRRMQ